MMHLILMFLLGCSVIIFRSKVDLILLICSFSKFICFVNKCRSSDVILPCKRELIMNNIHVNLLSAHIMATEVQNKEMPMHMDNSGNSLSKITYTLFHFFLFYLLIAYPFCASSEFLMFSPNPSSHLHFNLFSQN